MTNFIFPSTYRLLELSSNQANQELLSATEQASDVAGDGDTRHNTAFQSLTLIQHLAAERKQQLDITLNNSKILPIPPIDRARIQVGNVVGIILNNNAQVALSTPSPEVNVHIGSTVDALILGVVVNQMEEFVSGKDLLASSAALLAQSLLNRAEEDCVELAFLDNSARATIKSIGISELYDFNLFREV